jgi:cytochrome c oxidase subunit 4
MQEHTETHEPIDSVMTYALVFLALIAATIITAICKMLLVVLFFMHVRHSTKLTKLVLVGGVLWFFILIGMTYTDFGSRTWMGVPGR